MPFFSIYDRWDYTIPTRGGLSTEGWRYESQENVLEAWGQAHGCDTDSGLEDWSTPQDGGIRFFECRAFKGCKAPNGTVEDRKGIVAECLWDGYHGDWPADGVIAKVTFWWIQKHVLTEEEGGGVYVDPPASLWSSARSAANASTAANTTCTRHSALAQH